MHPSETKIEKEYKDDLDKFKISLDEEKRLQGKDKVYRIDTELDQFELLTLMESIFQLNGSASVSNDRKIIDLEMNPKERI